MKKKTIPILLLLAGLSTVAFAACEHKHDYKWKSSTDGGGSHWQECVGCGDKKNEGEHVDVKNNKTNAASPDGLCDDCGAHVHKYVWQSDALGHWQECVFDNNHKIEENAHADLKNNETDANTPDGLCDDCGREATVLFVMLGHGVKPANQYVALGEKATAPVVDDDDAFKFKGWYKDPACGDNDKFDFATDVIDTVTTLYAKWEEDTTPGASKLHAYELTEKVENLQDAEKGKAVYFKFTASTEGRYTVSLGAGTYSQNSTFTTTLTGDTVYGKDQTANDVTFDMAKGQTVYVLLTYQGDEENDVSAGVLLKETDDEPLPEDYFLSGLYVSNTYVISIDSRDDDNKKLTYDGKQYDFKYIAGGFDRVYFYVTENSDSTMYYIHHTEGGAYEFDNKKSSGTEPSKLYYAEQQTAVALNKLFGYYEPEKGGENDITELYIYESDKSGSTTVLIKQNGNYQRHEATYDTTHTNLLTFGQCAVTLNLASDDSVESLNVNGKTYVLKGKAGEIPPEKLPLGIDDTEDPAYSEAPEYYGTHGYSIRGGASQYFGATGNDGITVLSYAEDTGVYTIAAKIGSDFTTYQLVFSSDNKMITLKNADGTETLDTLTLFEYVYHDFPAAETAVTLQASDFQKGSLGTVYLYKVTTAGWYKFTGLPEGVTVYYDFTELNENSFDSSNSKTVKDDAVNLEEGTIVCVLVSEAAETEFTVAPDAGPAGWSSEKPLALNSDGYAVLTNASASHSYYFTYTAPDAGTYKLRVYSDGASSGVSNIVYYTVNGEEYGYYNDPEDWLKSGWKGDINNDNPVATVEIKAGDSLKLDIVVTVSGDDREMIKVVVIGDYSADATDITLTGTPQGDILKVSAEVDTGVNYHLAETHSEKVTATANAGFTVKTQSGLILDAVKNVLNDNKYEVSIPADTDYFRIVSATSQKIALAQSFNRGATSGFPIEATFTKDKYTFEATNKKPLYIELPVGTYTIDVIGEFDDMWEQIALTCGVAEVELGKVFTVTEGDLLVCTYLFDFGEETDAKSFTVQKLTKLFDEEKTGTYAGTLGSKTVSLKLDDVYGNIVYNTGDSRYTALVTESEGTYSFAYRYLDRTSYTYKNVTVTFSFSGDEFSVIDTDLGTATLEKQAEVTYITYTGTFPATDGSLTLQISSDRTKFIYTDTDGTVEGDLTVSGDTYSFNTAQDSCEFTISADGNTISFIHDYYVTAMDSAPAILTKQS